MTMADRSNHLAATVTQLVQLVAAILLRTLHDPHLPGRT